MIDGLAVVDKPAGMTSHDVVSRCRRIFGQKKVGHAGTLDPDATGVLLIGLGRATRLMQYMAGLPKSYTTTIVLGRATTTLDSSGEVTGRWDMSAVTLEDARRAAADLTGPIRQVPPMVSAVKIGGRRLHELARQGIEVERPAREVTVYRFSLEPGPGDRQTDPVLHAEIDCSSGTYIRVLADDLGRMLGGGAHVRDLRRTAVGPWRVEEAVPLDRLEPDRVLAPADALPWMEPVTVGTGMEAAVRHGRVVDRAELGPSGAGPWRVLGPAGDLLAVYEEHRGDSVKPRVVLGAEGGP
ncbi:MAG TPA: tRNA pseudouridine(55) synthase TruB [Acidimicrobiales bacterium]|nr:tRNA pseudouridine(55) synthase TruB [Acidimicrobiales bacterium]